MALPLKNAYEVYKTRIKSANTIESLSNLLRCIDTNKFLSFEKYEDLYSIIVNKKADILNKKRSTLK
jgi:hypothetical protein